MLLLSVQIVQCFSVVVRVFLVLILIYDQLSLGDDAYLFLWQLSTGERLQDIQCKFSEPITAVCWVEYGEIGPNRAFIFGCVDGSITLYRKTDKMVRVS